MRFLSLANRNLKEIFRDPLTLLLGVAMPVLLLFLFSSLFEVSDMDVFSIQSLTPSILIFSFSFIIMFTGTLLGKDRSTAFLTRLLATPLKPIDFLLAYLIPFVPVVLSQIIVCYAVGIALGATLTHFGFSLLILFMLSLTCISMGIIMGALLSQNQVSAVGAILITIISLFSGAWMDLRMVGGFFEKVGYVLPFAHGIEAIRTVGRGGGFSEVKENLIWIVVYVFVFFVAAIYALSWQTRRK